MPQNSHPDINYDLHPDESPKNQKVSRPGLLIGVGALILLAAFAVLAVIAVSFVNEHSERIKFFTVNALSLSVLAAIVVQALIYRGQWKAMQEGLKETRNLVAQNERVVRAAEQTADLTEKFSRINSRAYVFIDTVSLDAPIRSGKFPLPKIVLKNSGRSPAYNFRMRIQSAFLAGEAGEKAQKGIMPDMIPLSKKGQAIIGAGHVTVMHLDRDTWKGPEDEELAMTGKSTFYVWGLICYSDIFGREHSSKFSLWAQTPTTTRLSYGLYGNDFEDEEG